MSRKLKEKIDHRLSRERGTVYKDPGGKITIALVYPNTYHVGMSNLGFQGMYGLLNRMTDVVCERAFLPDERDYDEYVRTGTELFTMESKRELGRFDIVAFSVSFENDYPNIARILHLAKIPSMSSRRTVRHPLLIMGGACAFFNPEPVADFFDLCFIGEADEMLPEFLARYRATEDRTDLLLRSLTIEGVYVPCFYHIVRDATGKISERTSSAGAPLMVKRRYQHDLSSSGIKTSIITPETEFSDMYLVEAMRGCPWSCRFCVAGKIYSPPRIKKLPSITRDIREARGRTSRIGLIGPSLTDYPHIRDVLEISGVEFSITSLRAGRKSAELAALLRGHKSISIAPEAGTDRLRKALSKNISEEDILSTSLLLSSQGVETLRLYFMVGLPTETREDITGIIDLVRKIRDAVPKGRITLSISTFVPKPFTPFQWHPMEGLAEVKERLKMIRKALAPARGIRVFHDVPKYAYMQGVFSLGDRRIAKMLTEMSGTEDWAIAAALAGIDKDFFIFRRKDFDEILSWDFIDMGLPKEKLWTEYMEALSCNT